MSNGKETDKTHMQAYAVQFHVRDLERQVEFYTEIIGLQLQWKSNDAAGLGACSSNILLLNAKKEDQTHHALTINLPSRRELAIVVGRLLTINYANTTVDYGNRQCAHLKDPEGNEIEICVEIQGHPVHEEALPLDLEALLNELDPDDRLCDKMPDKTMLLNRCREEKKKRG